VFGVLRWRCLLLALCRAARHRGWPRAIGLLAWAVYLGVAPTAISFSTWAYALARSPAGRLGATTYLIPALAVAMSWLLLTRSLAGPRLEAAPLCLAGVAVARGVSLPCRGAPPERLIVAQ